MDMVEHSKYLPTTTKIYVVPSIIVLQNILRKTSQLLENLMTLRGHLSMTMEVLSRLTNRKLSFLSEGSQGGLKMLKSRIVLLQGEVV